MYTDTSSNMLYTMTSQGSANRSHFNRSLYCNYDHHNIIYYRYGETRRDNAIPVANYLPVHEFQLHRIVSLRGLSILSVEAINSHIV